MSNSAPNRNGSAEKRNLLIEQLEERALFDAVPIAPIDANMVEADAGAYLETVVSTSSTDVGSGAQQQEEVASQEVLFIDKSVDGFEDVVAEFVNGRDVDVFFINNASSGLEQIANHLEGRTDVQAIHIVSHANNAQLSLGNSVIGHPQLSSLYSSELARIGQSLADSGDILIYGCDLASSDDGEAFIEELSKLTNADVAASDDLTGSTEEGGDWNLEKQVGQIEAQSFSSTSFQGTLLETDAGFVVGTSPNLGDGEIAIVPQGEVGTSSFMYANAATANSGAITIDLELTLINTFDENGNLTTGTANQMPVTFGDWAASPVLLSRVIGSSVSGYEGHTAEILVEFFDNATGNPLSVVGDFTFHDIDFEPAGGGGSGSEAITILADEMRGYQVSSSPATEIDIIDNGDGTTKFTNDSSSGNANDEERWVSIQFHETTSHTLIFTARDSHTGYGLSTKNFSASPLSFSQPEAFDDDFATDQNTSISGNVVSVDNGNGIDSDPDGDTLIVGLVDGLAGNVGSATAGSNGGLFTINADGSYTFDPYGDFDYLPAGQTATTTISYLVSDGTGLADTATVSVIVTGLDDAPINVGSIPNQSDFETTPISAFDISSFFDAVDNDESLTFDAGATLPPGLTLDSTTGIITGTPVNHTYGSYSVSIVATDSDGETTTQVFAWTITNPGPSATDNTADVIKDDVLVDTGNVLTDDDGSGVDSDPDGDTLTVSAVDGLALNVGSSVTGSYGDVVINADGSYTYTLDNSNPAVVALATGSTLNDTFTYTVSDGDGGTSTATLNVTISNTINWSLTGDASVNEGNIASYLLSLEDGVAPGQSVSVDLALSDVDTNSSDYADFVAAVNAAIVGRPELSFVGSTLTYTAPTSYQISSSPLGGAFDDISGTGTGLNSSDDDSDLVAIGFGFDFFGVTQTNINIGSNGFVTFGGGSTEYQNQDFTAGDTIGGRAAIAAFWDDLNPADGDSDDVYFELKGAPGSQQFIVQWNQLVPYGGSSGQDVTFQLVLTEGSNDFEVRYLDTIAGGPNNDGASATIGVHDGGTEFVQWSYNTAAAVTSNTMLSFVAPSSTMAPITIDLGTVDDTLSESDEDFQITLSNASGNSGLASNFQVTTTIVDNDNVAPTATDNTAVVTEDGTLIDTGNLITDDDTFGVDTDPDGDTMTVNSVTGPLGAGSVGSPTAGDYGSIVINGDGSYTYALDNTNPTVNALDNLETLTETFTYSVTDGNGGTSNTATLTITINGANDAPIVGGTIGPQSDNDADTITTLDVTSVFSDPEGDTLTYTATGLPAGLTLDLSSGEITGTIDNSASQGGPLSDGVYSVEVTATDDNGESVSTTFTWTVTNPGPTANNDTNSTDEATATSGNVITASDTDPDGDTLTVDSVNGLPANVGNVVAGSNGGQFTINSDGSYTFDPNGDFEDLDVTEFRNTVVTYSITDSEGGTDTATLTVTVNGINDAPIVGGTIGAQSDNDADTIATLDVTTAFSDPEGDTLTYTATGLPAGLTLDLNSGEITGTIDNSASQGGPLSDGVYSVEVTATDDNGESVSTTFTWTVTNPGPTANNDTNSTDEATATSGNVITASDTDPDGDTLTVDSVNGLPANVGNVVAGSNGGQFTINSDGSYTFDPNGDFEDLDVTEFRNTVVTYSITDSEGGTDTATLTVTVNGINDAPIVGGTIASQSDNDADTIATLDVTSVFSDPEGDTLTYTATGLPAGLTLDLSSGEITGTIDNSASQGGPLSDGVYSVEVTATDDNGESVSTTFTWTVTNPGPTANNDTDSTDEATATSGNVITASDTDPDGDTLTVDSVNGLPANVGNVVAGSNGGQFTINSDGSYTFDPNGDFEDLDVTEFRNTVVTYSITDSEGGTDTATLTVTVNGINDAPIAGGTIASQSDNDADTITTLDVTSVFSDPEGDTLTYTATGLPAGLTLDLNSGEITGTIDNSASQGGPLSDGVYSVEVTATDDNGESVSTTFTWTVTNPGPTANNDTNSTDEATATSGNVITASDTDPDGDTLTVDSVNGLPANVGNVVAGSNGGQFTINSDGSYSFDPNGDFEDLDVTEFRNTVVTYSITDSEGGTDTATLTVTVNGINDAPIVGGTIGAQSDNDADTIATLDVTTAFSDPEGDTLTYTATGLPAGLTLDLNSGEITGTIDNSASQGGPLSDGVYSVEVTATDDNGESVSTTFTWTVTNPGPTANNDTDSTDEATATSGNVITASDTDPDGDTLTVDSVNGLPANVGNVVAGSNGGQFTINSDGSYSFDPNGDFEDLDVTEFRNTVVTYSITDSEGGTDTATLTVTVNGINDAPIVGGTIASQSDNDADTITTLDVTSVFSDPEGDTLTYTATGLPAGLTLDLNSGEITGTIDNSASQGGPLSDGVYSVEVTATDDNGESVSTTFTWTVTNPGPTANNDTNSTDEATATSGNVITASDTDPDGDTLTVDSVNGLPANVGNVVAGSNGGQFTINSDGSYTFDPNGDFEDLDVTEFRNTVVTYSITDSEGGTDTATLTVTVNGINDAPIVGGTIASQSDNDADTITTLDVTSVFSDPEGDTLTYTATGLPAGLTLDLNSGEITGTIDNSASQGGPLSDGVYSVEVTATDDNGESVSTTFTWTVTNPGPTANNDTNSTDEATATSGNVITASDTDPDGDTLTVDSVNGLPANVGNVVAGSNGGQFTINSDGSYTFDPSGDFEDLDVTEFRNTVVTYSITDSEGGTDTATLTVTVNGINDAPIAGGTIGAQSDNDADTIATLDVTTAFSDPEGDTLTYTATGLPAGLTLDLNSGEITGTIDNSASQGGPLSDGVYSVEVTATDDNGESVSTTFTWTVTNPGPTANNDTNSTDEATATSGNVITASDTDPDGDTLTVDSVNGLPANVGNVVAGSNGGQFTINSDGSYSFDPNGDFEDLDVTEFRNTVVTYSITDSEGGTDTATLTVTVNGINDAPIAGGTIGSQSDNDADTITTLDVTSVFSDPEGDTLTYTATGLPAGLTLDLNSGEITGTIDNSASQGGPLSDGVYSVEVTATDDNGASVSTTFTWTVTNPGPTANNDTDSTDEATATSGNVITASDTDPDGDTLTVDSVNGLPANVGNVVAGSNGGQFTINSDGSYTFDPSGDFEDLDVTEFRNTVVTYSITDSEGGTDTATLTVTVNGINDAPIVGGTIASQSDNDADTIATLDVTSSFSDPEGDTLTYTATGLPVGLTLDLNSGEITGTIDNSASQGGPLSDGVYSVEVTATDDNGESVSTTFTWTVTNPGPTANNDTDSTDEATATSGNVITASDTDPDGDTLTVDSVNGLPANVGNVVAGSNGGQFTINSDGSYSFDPSGDFEDLDVTEFRNTVVTYSITDSEGGTDTATLTVTVNGINDAPIAGGTIGAQSDNDADTIATLDVTTAFSDPEGDTLTYTATGLPAGLTLDLNSGEITGTIDNSASQGGPLSDGVYSVEVTATDDNGESVSTTFTWTVTNPGPTATDNDNSVAVDAVVTVTGNVISSNEGHGVDSDPDGDSLVVSQIDGGSGTVGGTTIGSFGDVVIDSDGSYTYTLDTANTDVVALGSAGTLTETFTYTVNDNEGGTSTATLTITINGSNDDPVVGGTIPSQSDMDDDSVATLDVSSYFSDPDGDTLNYTATGLPSGLSLDLNSGEITGTIDNSDSQGGPLSDGVYTVEVTADDGNTGTVSTTFTWTVGNPVPTANNDTDSTDEATATSGNVITASDTDPDGDALTVDSVNGLPANVGNVVAGSNGGQFTINSDGSYTFDPSGDFKDLDVTEFRNTVVTYSITDSEGGTDTATLTVTVNGINDAPIVGSTIASQSDQDDDTIATLDVTSVFSDPEGDALTYTATGLPAGLTLDLNSGEITGTIDNSASQGGPLSDGVYSVEVTATDDNGESVSTTFTWTVTNPGPTANNDTNSTDEATATSGNVITASDTDPDADTLTVDSVNGLPANVGNVVAGSNGGQFTINSDGSYSFDPNGDFKDLDVTEFRNTVVTYSITDSEGGTDTATLTVTVNGINDAPIAGGTIGAQSDNDADTIATLDVTTAFSDPEGDTLTYTATGLPAGLTLDLNSGEITGTVDNSASQGGPLSDGVYSVEVTATDDNGESVSTTFTWTVTNPGPTANNDTNSTDEATATSGNVITASDTDPDGDTLTVDSVNGLPANVGNVVAGSNGGQFTINSDGSYSFDPNGDFKDLDVTEFRNTVVTYSITDSEGGTDTATLTVTVNGINDAPIVGGTIGAQSDNDADTIATLDVTTAFSDPEGDTLTYTATGLPAGLTLDLNSGEITGTIDNSASQGGPLSDGVYSVEVTATDDNGESVSTTFTWTVTNPGPTANNDTDSTDEATATSGNVITASDTDPDADTLTVDSVNGLPANVGNVVAGSNGGQFTINSDGSYSFNPNGDFEDLDVTEFRNTVVTYSITDSEGGTDTATLTVTVNGINDAPIAGGTIGAQSDNDADTIATLDVTTAFSDPEGDTLTYTATGLPAGLTLDLNSGEITGTIDNSASQGGPLLDGVYSVEVTATDDNGESVSTTFTWTVTNPGPTANNDTNSTDEATAASGNVITASDTDPDGDPLTVDSVSGLPANVGNVVAGSNGGQFTINSDGSYTFDPSGDFEDLDVTEFRNTVVTYSITDSEGGTDTATLTVTVNGINDAPIVGGTIASESDNDADTITTLDVTSVFSDPEGDTLTYTATGLPAGLTLDLNSGEITGTIDNSASQGGPLSDGVYSVEVTATDDNGESVSTTFTWTVTNPGPTANNDTNSTDEATATSGNVITASDTDPDGDTLTVDSVNGLLANVGNVVAGSNGGQFTINSDGSYTFDPNGDFDDLDVTEFRNTVVTYSITDSEGGTDTATLTVTVNGINDAPIVGGTIASQSDNDADTIATLDVTSVFSDPEGDTLTYTATGLPAGLTLDLNSGEITGTIDNSASQGGPLSDGVYSVEVTATDDNGESVSTTFTWTVTNPGPTANNDTDSTDEATATSGNVITASDTDPDGDTLTVDSVNGLPANVGNVVAGSNGGQFTINSDGSYSFDPNGDFEDLDVTEFRNTVVTYSITDSEGGTDTATLTVTVNGINDAPIVGGTIASQSDNDADTITTLDVTSVFSDPEGDTLTYTATGLPAGLTLDLSSGEITGTIDNSASQGGPLSDGVYSVEVTATDDNGESVSTTFTWTVTNPGPTANNDTNSTDEATATSGNVITASDTDPDGDTLTVDSVNGLPANVGNVVAGSNGGQFTINSDGSYSFDPNGDFEDLDVTEFRNTVVTYSITDSEGGTDTATLTVTVNGINDAPIAGGTIGAQSDNDADTIATLDVTTAFSDPEGDTLTYTATGLPAGLTLDLNSGEITGTIDNSASQGGPLSDGVYSVEVTAMDDNGESVSTTFTWTVTNPGPTATDNANTVVEDTSLIQIGNVIDDEDGFGVDNDPDGDSLTVSSFDGSAANVGTTVNGDYGTIVLNNDGSYTYTLDNTNPAVAGMGPGDTLTDAFTYTISDGEGGSSTANIAITIKPSNDAPTAVAIPSQSNFDSESPTFDVSPFFADADGDALTFVANNLPPGLTINIGTGEITGLIDSSDSQGGPALDGVYTVEIVASDGSGESTSTTFTWTISNPGPVAGDDGFTTDEDTLLSATVAGNDSDPDGDTVSFALSGSGTSNGSVVVNSDGSFTYLADPDFNGSDSFDYTITDADGAVAIATVNITIDPVNDAPVVDTTTPDQTSIDSEMISFNVSPNFSDIESGLAFSATGLPTGLTIDSSGEITGTIDSSASQGGPLSNGIYTVVVTATDSGGETVTDTFSWTINNPGPNAVDDVFNTDEDTTLLATVASNDSDPDGDSVTYNLVGAGPDNGTILFNTNGSFTYDPDADFNGVDSFDYEIVDADGSKSTATAQITVDPVNDAPSVDTPISDRADVDSLSVSLDISGAFSDVEGNTLSYSVSGLPGGLMIDSNTGIISGTIDSSASQGGPSLDGSYLVTVTANDGNGGFTTDTFTWSITNPSPVSTDDNFSTDEDTPFSGSVTGNDFDPDSDTSTFSTTVPPSNGTLSWNSDGTFTYTPDADFHGTDTFSYQMLDADGATSTAVVNIDIFPVNDAPVADDDFETVAEDTPIIVNVLSNDSDPDGDLLNVMITTPPSNGSVVVNPDGSVTYTPHTDFNGIDTFEYQVCDPSGECASATVTIDVTPINDLPIAMGETFTTDEDMPLVGSVAGNDADPDGDALTYKLTSPPSNGSLAFNPDGSFNFIPNANFHGSTTFEYNVCDPDGAIDTATATINVTPVNDGPDAIDDSASSDEDSTVIIDLLDNDGDPDGDTIHVIEINGNSIIPGETLWLPSGAKVTLNINGTATYDPNGQYNDLQVGHSALDTFLYTISDGNGGTSVAESVIMINGMNDVPVAEDDYVITTVDTPVTIKVLGNDHDPDLQPLSVILLNTPANGTTVVNPDGTLVYTPEPGWEGTVTIHYLIEDPDGASDDATVTIEVEPAFRFDSFTNFSESSMAKTPGSQPQGLNPRLLSQQIFTLAPEPIFSGFARPGTQIVGRIYDTSGSLVGEASANTDPGGNWMMQFQNAKGHDFYRIEFEQVSAGAADVYGYLGLNPGDNSYQSMEPMTVYDRPLSVENAMQDSRDSLGDAHRQNTDPMGFGN